MQIQIMLGLSLLEPPLPPQARRARNAKLYIW